MYPSLKIAVKLLKWKPKISFSKGLNKTIIAYTKANIWNLKILKPQLFYVEAEEQG